MTYAVIAIVMWIVVAVAMLKLINHNDGSVDGPDVFLALMLGFFSGIGWPLALLIAVVGGIVWYLFNLDFSKLNFTSKKK